jgi:hypothetical protein
VNIQAIQPSPAAGKTVDVQRAKRIHELMRATPNGMTASALSRAIGLDQVEVYAVLVWLYERQMARPDIVIRKGLHHVTSWSAMQ